MNKQQTCVHTTGHTIHEEDNCDGCQLERKQNNMLVDFYERLNKIESKVQRIKQNVGVQKDASLTDKQKVEHMGTVLASKPDKVIEQIQNQNSKEMGYQLASALIEREIKVKLQNNRLQSIIQQLQKDKLKLQEQRRQSQLAKSRPTMSNLMSHSEKKSQFWHDAQPSRYSDVIDEIRRTNSIESTDFRSKKKEKETRNSYFRDLDDSKRYWQAGEDHGETSFSSFTVPPNTRQDSDKVSQKSKYEGLNLWLYDFKTQQLDSNPIKSLRKPLRRVQKGGQAKYKSKF